MSKKILSAFLITAIFAVALSAMVTIRPVEENVPAPITETKAAETEAVPEPIPTSYKVILKDGAVCLYTIDESGTELSRKIIDYIDIYSLYDSQLEILRSGAVFDSREAAAEFIQDLGS